MMQSSTLTEPKYPDFLKESMIDAIPKIRRLVCAKNERWWGKDLPCWSWGDDWTSVSIDEEPFIKCTAKHCWNCFKREPDVLPLQSNNLPAAPSKLYELSSVDKLFITKRLRVRQVMFLRGKKNRFYVKTSPTQNLLYTIEEENRWWVGYFCYGLRPLILKVFNRAGEEVMRIVRPYAFTGRVMPCHLQRIKVYSPPGQAIGSVEQIWTAIRPHYVVKDLLGDVKFRINGPCITVSCCNEVRFEIRRCDETSSTVGFTSKRWQGLMHALFYSSITDKFNVKFDLNLSPEEKGLLLAATLLMDYMYYDA